MGLGDFLASLGEGRGGQLGAAGAIGEAFGGKSPKQQRLDAFTQGELPTIADALEKATTRPEIEDATKKLSAAWYKAGLPIEGDAFDKFAERMTGSAIRRVQAADLESIRRDYGPQTTPLTPQVAPEGQGQPLGLDTAFAPQTTPAKPLDVQGAARYFEATGAKPQSFQEIFGTPALIQQREAAAGAENATKSYRQTQQAVEEIQQRGLEGLPETPIPGTGMTTRSLGQATRGQGLSSLVREQDPLLEQRRRLLQAETTRAERPERPERRRLTTRDLGDRIETIDQDTGDVVSTQPKGTISTETAGPVKGVDRIELERSIARLAVDRGIKDPAGIKKLFQSQGYDVEGEPQLNVPGPTPTPILGRLGVPGAVEKDKEGKPIVAPPTLTGDFNIISKPKTVTRRPGGAAPAPQGQPAAPRPGTIVRGYEFQGGDPADQKNWKKVAAR